VDHPRRGLFFSRHKLHQTNLHSGPVCLPQLSNQNDEAVCGQRSVSNPQIFFASKREQTLGLRTSSHSRLLLSCSFLFCTPHLPPSGFFPVSLLHIFFSLFLFHIFSSLCQSLLYHGYLSFRRVANTTRHFTSIYSHPNAKIVSPIQEDRSLAFFLFFFFFHPVPLRPQNVLDPDLPYMWT
jgi:hypothetical protein